IYANCGLKSTRIFGSQAIDFSQWWLTETTALPVSVTNAQKDLNELTKVLQKGVTSLANPTLLRLQVAKKSPLKIRHDH
ncbi:hypothetical protein AALT52_02065, partial [Ligilactobacillus faecis]